MAVVSQGSPLLSSRPGRSSAVLAMLAALAAVALISCVVLSGYSSSATELEQKHVMSTQKADNDLRSYFQKQQKIAAAPRATVKHADKKHLIGSNKPPKFGESTADADAELDRYFNNQQKLAKQPRVAAKPAMHGPAKKVKEAPPKHGISTKAAMSDLNKYFQAAQPAGKTTKQAKKGLTEKLYLPWYEVSSTGDGLGPENVNIWSVPPELMNQDSSAKAAQTDMLAGYPLPPNTYQDATKWNADSALNGGNKEWAEEDAALHAYNMQRWRNRILDEQVRRQRTQWDLMNSHYDCDYRCDGGRCWCAHFNRGYRSTKGEGGPPRLEAPPSSAVLAGGAQGSGNDLDLAANLRLLEEDAAKALAALQTESGAPAATEDKNVAKQMAAIVAAISKEASSQGKAEAEAE